MTSLLGVVKGATKHNFFKILSSSHLKPHQVALTVVVECGQRWSKLKIFNQRGQWNTVSQPSVKLLFKYLKYNNTRFLRSVKFDIYHFNWLTICGILGISVFFGGEMLNLLYILFFELLVLNYWNSPGCQKIHKFLQNNEGLSVLNGSYSPGVTVCLTTKNCFYQYCCYCYLYNQVHAFQRCHRNFLFFTVFI